MPLAVSLNGKWDRRVSWNLQSLWKATGVSMCSKYAKYFFQQRRPFWAFMGHMMVGRRQQTLCCCDPSRERNLPTSLHLRVKQEETRSQLFWLCVHLTATLQPASAKCSLKPLLSGDVMCSLLDFHWIRGSCEVVGLLSASEFFPQSGELEFVLHFKVKCDFVT